MSNYQTVFQHCEAGRIIRCAECDIIQVAFKNLTLTFYPVDFNESSQCMKAVCTAIIDSSENSIRSVTIPLPCDGIKLLLSKAEVNQLINMLNAVIPEMRSPEMIRLIKDQFPFLRNVETTVRQ